MSDLGQCSAKVWFRAESLSYNTATSAELVHVYVSGICAEPDPWSDYHHHFYTGHVVPNYSFPVSLHGGADAFHCWESCPSLGALKFLQPILGGSWK